MLVSDGMCSTWMHFDCWSIVTRVYQVNKRQRWDCCSLRISVSPRFGKYVLSWLSLDRSSWEYMSIHVVVQRSTISGSFFEHVSSCSTF